MSPSQCRGDLIHGGDGDTNGAAASCRLMIGADIVVLTCGASSTPRSRHHAAMTWILLSRASPSSRSCGYPVPYDLWREVSIGPALALDQLAHTSPDS